MKTKPTNQRIRIMPPRCVYSVHFFVVLKADLFKTSCVLPRLCSVYPLSRDFDDEQRQPAISRGTRHDRRCRRMRETLQDSATPMYRRSSSFLKYRISPDTLHSNVAYGGIFETPISRVLKNMVSHRFTLGSLTPTKPVAPIPEHHQNRSWTPSEGPRMPCEDLPILNSVDRPTHCLPFTTI